MVLLDGLEVRRTHGATRRTGSPSYKLRMVSSILPLALENNRPSVPELSKNHQQAPPEIIALYSLPFFRKGLYSTVGRTSVCRSQVRQKQTDQDWRPFCSANVCDRTPRLRFDWVTVEAHVGLSRLVNFGCSDRCKLFFEQSFGQIAPFLGHLFRKDFLNVPVLFLQRFEVAALLIDGQNW